MPALVQFFGGEMFDTYDFRLLQLSSVWTGSGSVEFWEERKGVKGRSLGRREDCVDGLNGFSDTFKTVLFMTQSHYCPVKHKPAPDSPDSGVN
ncbi:hypothetical protein [Parendozoicomonas sp. Alg238-R29]|uniref:hypothetical protein n=1 Tax=Parendozoicomonas sp. Alg238-R29 TaxID=2993446 RepID=UPI00248EC6EB|nr:hypothetical protein [Parendozoicomonas sp. Alg238-R29]